MYHLYYNSPNGKVFIGTCFDNEGDAAANAIRLTSMNSSYGLEIKYEKK